MAESTMRTVAFITRRTVEGNRAKDVYLLKQGSEVRIDNETGLIRFLFDGAYHVIETRYHLKDIESYSLVDMQFDGFTEEFSLRVRDLAKAHG